MNKSAIKHLKKLLLAVCLIPAETHAATVKWTDGGITFEADDTKSEATAATTTNTGEVTIPSSVAYNGKTYTVTIIKSQFIGTNNKTVTSVTIPSTVNTIMPGAFGFSDAMEEMKVDGQNQYFCAIDGVLYNKAQTAIIYWPATKEAGDLVIPSTVTRIGGDAFSHNKTLTSVTIPASVVSIGDGLTQYGVSQGAFAVCSKLTAVTFETGSTLERIPSFCFVRCSTLTAISLPNSVRSIGPYAFRDCSSLAVSLPPNLEVISSNAFEGCDAITEVIFPSTMKSILSTAFNNCGKLQKVVMPDDCSVTAIPTNCFSFNRNLTEVRLSNKITTINARAFYSCQKLASIDLPTELRTIGTNAFHSNSALESVVFHDNLTTIGDGAFGQCKKLKDIDLPQSLKTIGIGAFKSAAAETVTIPASVTAVGGAAFARTANMKAFSVEPGNSNYISVEGVLFTRDMKTLEAYPAASVRDVAYTVPAGVTTIQEGAFSDARLTHVTLPSTLTTIYNGAFAYNVNLTELTIPAAVSSIGRSNISNSEIAMTNENIILGTSVASLYLLNPSTPPVISTANDAKYVVPNRVGSLTAPQFPKVYVKKTAYDGGVYQGASLWNRMSIGCDIPVTLPTSGLKTMGRDFDVDLSSSDMKAYVAVSVDHDGDTPMANMEEIAVPGKAAGKYVPSRTGLHTVNGTDYETYTGVVLKGDAGASSSYRIGEDDDAATTQANCLVAATDATRVAMTETREGTPYTNMGLNGGKFRPFTADGTMAYNKCWLSIPTSMVGTAAGAKALMLDFDGATTGIAGIDAEPTNGASATEGYYTLQGVRVNQPHKGVYIYKGKKIVIK